MIEAQLLIKLKEWSRWKYASGMALGYKKQSSFVGLAGGGDSLQSKYDDDVYDSECRRVDAAIELLPQLHQTVIRVEYLAGGTEIQKALWFGRSPRVYRECRSEAYSRLLVLFENNLISQPDSGIKELHCA